MKRLTMNEIFFFLVLVAFVAAAAREVLVTVDPATLGPASDAWASLRSMVQLDADAKGQPIGPMNALTASILDSAKLAVDLALKFVGGMALFLGLMKVVEAGGGLRIAARAIRPLMIRLFPDVPPDHPAMGAMIMNLAANALGLGNAATPFGIRAMQELDKLNAHKGSATNAMVLFLTINTSGVTLLATGVMVIRRELGSVTPAAVIGTTLFATMCSTVVGVLVCKLLERISPVPEPTNEIEATERDGDTESYPLWVPLLVLAGLIAFMGASLRYGEAVSAWMVPVLVMGFLTFGMARGVKVYETLVEGAKEGFDVAIRIIPYLVAILVAVGMLRSSGALDGFVGLVGPLTTRVGLPAEALPMALLRPLSGSGASGVMMATLADPATGPDTYTGLLVSTMQGSTETTFYVLAVYYGAVRVAQTRHTLAAALTADLVGVIGSILAVSAYFRFAG